MTIPSPDIPFATPGGRPIEVRIFHQTDPAGVIASGIGTFIRGLIKTAPPDIRFSVVGLTTDHVKRPVGRWTTLKLGDRDAKFFAVARNRNPGKRSFIPLSLKFVLGIYNYYGDCSSNCDVLEFHRFEPVIPFLGDLRPKTAFVHQDMEVISNHQSDIRWKYLPGLYFTLERHAVPACNSIFGVRETAINAYRAKNPEIADRFHFVPTWMDPDLFYPKDNDCKTALRQFADRRFNFDASDEILMSAGRLDLQKNPMLLVESFGKVHQVRPRSRLVVVGDGAMRSALVDRVKTLGLERRVLFAGLRSPREIADWMQIADCFLLTSAYEGMPVCVLEALACGVPIVTTNVGEVERIVRHGVNGRIVEHHSANAFAHGVLELLSNKQAYVGAPCTEAVRDYVPAKVLSGVYENYRMLADFRRNAAACHRHVDLSV